LACGAGGVSLPNKIQPILFRFFADQAGSGIDGAAYINDSDGNPNVFNVNRNGDGKSWLNDNWAKPDNRWNSNNEFVFRLRKCFLPAASKVAVFLFQIFQTIFPTAEHLADFLKF
jgi:hypothetical protein